ncbi:PH domain-containing protein [Catenuloplanes japonicus]|uniref:PH domain-containing protein n=1 Tax=Catenuloplanes japonicus TaxID=33876 RepID=UPI000525798B|nr:PH domain-containing protein [Catenuloplanes japonicus]
MRRLSLRLVWVDLIRAAATSVPGYVGIVVLGDDGPVWPLVVASVIGVLRALSDLVRLLTTRYAVHPDRVEMRSGWIARRHRTVARDRIRSVDTGARLMHRPFGLRVVHIGTGERESSFSLDALDRRDAALLRGELLGAVERPAETPAIATIRPAWVLYNAARVWAVFAVVGPAFGIYWFLRLFDVDARELYHLLGPVWIVALAYPIGILLNAAAFLAENWRFTLFREGDTLVTRRGLFHTRTVQRDDRRVRGVAFKEPLAWRRLRLTETSLITTGLRAESGAGTLLPRLPRAEARAAAAQVLTDGHRPLEAPLRRHPRGALTSLLIRAVAGPVIVSGVLGAFTLSGAIPGPWWALPLSALPVTLLLAVAGFRALGHTMSGPYLVLRRGAVNRHTVALRRDAVVGWKLRQTVFQRWGDRMTVGVATPAGFYEAQDASVDQAMTLMNEARTFTTEVPTAVPAIGPAV